MNNENSTPLVVLNMKKLRDNFRTLSECLPSVKIHYAIKALYDETVIDCLKLCGCNFDVATTGEIKILKKLNVNAETCIHTHPIKKDKDIKDALDFGITTFVVDNITELQKFNKYKHVAKILLRVSFRSKTAKVDLSKKFGCDYDAANNLLDQAKELGINVVGLSFHVGSQTKNPDDHVNAINKCIVLMEQNPQLKVLDIGGGFPALYDDTDMDIKTFCEPIRIALERAPSGSTLLCEPGRYMVANIGKAYMTVVGMAVRDGVRWLYVDDGVYGTFSGKIYDHVNYIVKKDTSQQAEKYPLIKCVIAGPTCDSIDVIQEEAELPADVKVGDILYSNNVGAYTIASSCTFNSLPLPKIKYLW